MTRLPRPRVLPRVLARVTAISGGYFAPDPVALRLGGLALAIAVVAPFALWAPLADELGELGCEFAANSPIYTHRAREACNHPSVRWSSAGRRWARTCNHCNRELEGRPTL